MSRNPRRRNVRRYRGVPIRKARVHVRRWLPGSVTTTVICSRSFAPRAHAVDADVLRREGHGAVHVRRRPRRRDGRQRRVHLQTTLVPALVGEEEIVSAASAKGRRSRVAVRPGSCSIRPRTTRSGPASSSTCTRPGSSRVRSRSRRRHPRAPTSRSDEPHDDRGHGRGSRSQARRVRGGAAVRAAPRRARPSSPPTAPPSAACR